MFKTLFMTCFFLVFIAAIIPAETIKLKNGQIVEGKIIERTDKYLKVDLYGASVVYYLEEIDKIDESQTVDSEKPAKSLTPTDIESQNEMIINSAAANLDKATFAFNKAISADPDNAVAYNNMGVISAKAGNFQEALNYYKKAAEMKSDYADPYNNMGALYCSLGNNEVAIDSYSKALAIDSNNKPTNYNLANLYAFKKDNENAIFYYQKVIEIDPDFAKAYANIGIILDSLGRKEEAKEYFTKAAEKFRLHNDLENAVKAENWLSLNGH